MRWFLRRSGFYLVTAWAAVTLNFLIPRIMPGDPVQAVMARFQAQGTPLSPEATKALAVAFGLQGHQNLWSQYLSYWGNLFHANLGVSFTYFPTQVSSVIAQALPWTVILVGISTIIAPTPWMSAGQRHRSEPISGTVTGSAATSTPALVRRRR